MKSNISKKENLKKVKDFNIMLAGQRGHGRYVLVSKNFTSVYDKMQFVYTDFMKHEVKYRFKIEPYVLLNSIASIKTIMGKKRELKLVKNRLEEVLKTKVFITEDTLVGSPFIYTFFNFVKEGKLHSYLYVDETFYESETTYNAKFHSLYSKKLNYKYILSDTYKFYITEIMDL